VSVEAGGAGAREHYQKDNVTGIFVADQLA
jgi:hypothetical protein